jgi:hypothetical protein
MEAVRAKQEERKTESWNIENGKLKSGRRKENMKIQKEQPFIEGFDSVGSRQSLTDYRFRDVSDCSPRQNMIK